MRFYRCHVPKSNAMNVRLIVLILAIVITASIEHITIPIMVTYFESMYFILIVSSLHGCVNFGTIILIKTRGSCVRPKKFKISMLAGFFNALMSMCFVYAANPVRTPVVIQSIFLGFAIIPSVLFRKLILGLDKRVTYNPKYIVPSVLCLAISVGIAVTPLFITSDSDENGNGSGISLWIALYLCAVILLSLDNTLQEKYSIRTKDNTLLNRVSFAFYTSMCQFITLIPMFGVEYVFGYTDSPGTAFVRSAYMFVQNIGNFVLLELFILDCLALYVLSIYLNGVSTNYNMILTNITNQSVAIFFTIFPSLNSGIRYPIYITLLSLVFNVTSVGLWIKGEHNEDVSGDVQDDRDDQGDRNDQGDRDETNWARLMDRIEPVDRAKVGP